jgi:hypothetical protein
VSGQVERIASLLRERNVLDEQIGAIIQRPMTSGHLGEWVAAQVFGIELAASAIQAGIDGRFTAGPLEGCSVNVKWYLKREGLVDLTESPVLDYYLILAGLRSAALSSRGGLRPWRIAASRSGQRRASELISGTPRRSIRAQLTRRCPCPPSRRRCSGSSNRRCDRVIPGFG